MSYIEWVIYVKYAKFGQLGESKIKRSEDRKQSMKQHLSQGESNAIFCRVTWRIQVILVSIYLNYKKIVLSRNILRDESLKKKCLQSIQIWWFEKKCLKHHLLVTVISQWHHSRGHMVSVWDNYQTYRLRKLFYAISMESKVIFTDANLIVLNLDYEKMWEI